MPVVKGHLEELLGRGPALTAAEVGGLAAWGVDVLQYGSVFAREDPILATAARSIAQSKTGLMLLSSAPLGHTCEFPFGNRLVTSPAYGPESRAHIYSWIDGWYGALMSRDQRSLDLLSGTADDVLRASPSMGEECAYAWKGALVAFHSAPDAALPHIERAIELTAEDKMTMTRKGGGTLFATVFAQLAAIVRRDAEGFETTLVGALEAHKRFWKTPSRARNPLGWVAWGPLALACLAHDRGISVRVESEYLLPILIERRS